MINVLGPRPRERVDGRGEGGGPRLRGCAVRQRGRAVRARRAAPGRDHAGAVPRPEREDRRLRDRRRAGPRAARGRRLRRSRTPTAAARSTRANNLDQVPIIDHAGPDPGLAHDYVHTWWMRDRLEREQGHLEQPRALVRADPADRRLRLGDRGDARDGPLARRRRGRRLEQAAPAEDRRRQARRTSRTAAPRPSASSTSRRATKLRARSPTVRRRATSTSAS